MFVPTTKGYRGRKLLGDMATSDTDVFNSLECVYLPIPEQDEAKALLQYDIYSIIESEISLLESIVGGSRLRRLKLQIDKSQLFMTNLRRTLVESDARHYPEAADVAGQALMGIQSRFVLDYFCAYVEPDVFDDLLRCPGCHELGKSKNECSSCAGMLGRCCICSDIGPIGLECNQCGEDSCGRYMEALKHGDANNFDRGRFVVDSDDEEDDEAAMDDTSEEGDGGDGGGRDPHLVPCTGNP